MATDNRPDVSKVYWPDEGRSDEALLWGAIAGAAAILAAITWFAMRAWHNGLEPSHEKIIGCANELPNGGYEKCVHVSYPWPTLHPWLMAGIVFLAVLVLARIYLFMRRVETRS